MRYHNITKDDMLNGDGLRVVLWLSGCSHCCEGCQNPITWDSEGGLPFDAAAKQEIFDELDKDYISGITFSGGDPLFYKNRADVAELIDEIREKYPDKTIWLYTGYEWEAIRDLPMMRKIDVVIDGLFVLSLLDKQLKWRGSSNQKVIDVQKSLQNEDKEAVLFCD
ncbi:MAG: anaerobic ribonucleoside-triphosphate reductase activating protein [Lachnospiraceae bacterium]|nr:anaerobic ribonucleoside-triphosphate reductase activating protein [Lachnospiraceae bacterium]